MDIAGQAVTAGTAFCLFIALLFALSFEFVNGFHDTANAVATVIYTNSLKPVHAVVWSGLWNLIGVMVSTGGVAYGILAILPVELVMNVGSGAGFAMVFSLLLSAIIWNVGTWYLGLPASSSHTLIGSIMGVGLANAIMNGKGFAAGVNWGQAQNVFLALLCSPIIGFVLSALLLLAAKALIKRPELFKAPAEGAPPPSWVRGLLVLTCTGVSFAHGNNDGQKGMGLIMLVMIGILPASFALDMHATGKNLQKISAASSTMAATFQGHAPGNILTIDESKKDLNTFLKQSGKADANTYPAMAAVSLEIKSKLAGVSSVGQLAAPDRTTLRSDMYLVAGAIKKLDSKKLITDKKEDKAAVKYQKSLERVTQYIPNWVKIAVAIALGFGTMIGWKRIVVTVGEKIGKEHLTYGQGAAAELVAMGTIMAASVVSLPVSTTHILSSGIAGTMAANGSGLQKSTMRNIVLAWVLTLPVCVLLGAGLFSMALYFVAHILHLG